MQSGILIIRGSSKQLVHIIEKTEHWVRVMCKPQRQQRQQGLASLPVFSNAALVNMARNVGDAVCASPEYTPSVLHRRDLAGECEKGFIIPTDAFSTKLQGVNWPPRHVRSRRQLFCPNAVLLSVFGETHDTRVSQDLRCSSNAVLD
ncbi:hypothetical protein TcWFU_008716 [Taenia crassiceps]|uniref:Uncharacterized protein n=1 Tax=Taenia crassiceps TaxID=6207 RepID=A0ABR4Q9V6_9CEST